MPIAWSGRGCYPTSVHRSTLLVLAGLCSFACDDTHGPGFGGPTTNVRTAPCTAPMCAVPCTCDVSTICDPDCASCDPECGQCRGIGRCIDTTDGGTADAGRPSGPAGLVVIDAYQSSHVDNTAANAGERFVIISIVLANNSTVSFPLTPTLFTLATTTGLTIPGDAATSQHASGCPANASLSMGNDITCVIVFRAPDHDTASLTYAAPGGPRATVPVMARRCTECGRRCVDSANDRENCGGCGREVVNGSCVGGQPTCATALSICGLTCVNLATDPMHCGMCNRTIDDRQQRCVNGMPRCTDTNRLACGSECVDTGSDRDHCGRCNAPCNGLSCNEGQCGEFMHVPQRRSCADICGTRMCFEAAAEYDGAPCNDTVIQRLRFRNCTQVPPATFTPPNDPAMCARPFAQSICFCGP